MRDDGNPVEFHGDPVVVGDLVVTGCDRGARTHTYAFARETGEVVWKRPDSVLESDLLLVGEWVIGRRWNGDLLALSADGGELGWLIQPEDYAYPHWAGAGPAAVDGTVWFGGVDGAVYAVAGADGEVLWRRDLGDALATAVACDGRDLYACTVDGEIHRLDAVSGEILASTRFGSAYGRPLLDDDHLYVLVSDEGLVAFDRSLGADASESGLLRWQRDLGRDWSSDQPLLWRETIVVGTWDGEAIGYRVENGEEGFTQLVDGAVRGLGAHGDLLLVGTLDGVLYACRPDLASR